MCLLGIARGEKNCLGLRESPLLPFLLCKHTINLLLCELGFLGFGIERARKKQFGRLNRLFEEEEKSAANELISAIAASAVKECN